MAFNEWVLVIGGIIVSGSSIFATAYLKKKGANLAQKEDLEKITTTVEEIRNSYSKELEFLKSKLNILNEKEKSMFVVEKDSIIEFYSNACNYLFIDLRFVFSSNRDPLLVKEKENLILNSYNNVRSNLSKLELLCNDIGVVELAFEFDRELVNYKVFMEEILGLYKANLEENSIYLNYMKTSYAKFGKEEDFTIPQEILDRGKVLREEEGLIIARYFKESELYFTNALTRKNAFQDSLKSYFKVI